jgi:two-component system, OmpR family, alkaline phosphatase synthesis response regulator PhoP
MLRLITTNNVDVFRHLGSPAFQRLGIQYDIASSYDEALAKIRSAPPRIVLLDADLAGGSGFDLCRTIKNDPALHGTHVALILSNLLTRDTLGRVLQSGCDDVLAMPLHPDDFYHHIAQVAGLPFRRERRVGVSLEILITSDGATSPPIQGEVMNVGARGAGVVVPVALEPGSHLTVRINHDGHVYGDTSATVVWCKPGEPRELDGFSAGLSFTGEVPMKVKLLLETLALFDVSPAPDGGVTVSLQGDFTEMTSFAPLIERLEGETRIDFNASAIRYMSSAGVRAWCQFLARLDGKRYSFRHCSVAFTSQAAMVPMVVGDGEVLSLEAPYLCESCDREELRLLETRALLREEGRVSPPQLTCSVCGGELAFDDVADRYFAFLKEPGTALAK